MGANTQGNVAALALGIELVVASIYANMTRREAARVGVCLSIVTLAS